jgi:hypothetical protein
MRSLYRVIYGDVKVDLTNASAWLPVEVGSYFCSAKNAGVLDSGASLRGRLQPGFSAG